jgi:hypothetical protein
VRPQEEEEEVAEPLSFSRRFRGFDHGALGGYVAGAVARRIEGPAEANLRALPPMEQELKLKEGAEGALELIDGDTLVLEAKATSFELEIPDPLSPDEAEDASHRLLHEEGEPHLYPGCFTCGPDRDQGDGLRLFMGRTDREDLLASSWTPHPGLADGEELPAEMVWAALDCPTIWAVGAFPEGMFYVLARQRVETLAPVGLGEPAIVSAWPISHDGRKHLSGAAIHADDGTLLARGESLLIEVPRPG